MDGLVFAIVAVLAILAVAYIAFRLLCAPRGHFVGYWSTPRGDLYHIRKTAAGLAVEAAPRSGGGSYRAAPVGCRGVSVTHSSGEMRGKLSLDRRRIIWKGSPPWYRQGL